MREIIIDIVGKASDDTLEWEKKGERGRQEGGVA